MTCTCTATRILHCARHDDGWLTLSQNEEEQRLRGETVPDDPFDSNCITPGTEFMARLGKHLRFFIRRKMAEDPLWQKPAVVFSGRLPHMAVRYKLGFGFRL
jgi:5'-3' exonuclease